MSDGPDLQSLIRNSTPHREGESHILCLIPDKVNVFSQMAMPSGPIKFDGKMQYGAPKKPCLLDKGCKALGFDRNEICAAFKKVGDAGAVRQVSIAEITGQGGFSSGLGNFTGIESGGSQIS